MLNKDEFFCWFREDKKQKIYLDFISATKRFVAKFAIPPTKLIIPKSEKDIWEGIEDVIIIPNEYLRERYFGLQ